MFSLTRSAMLASRTASSRHDQLPTRHHGREPTLDTERIHRVVSDDGTEIAGRVRGQGPPLVLIHGGLEDGNMYEGPALEYLSARFTCYLPSMRGRGLSGDHPDHSPERHVEDFRAFVDSIGEPVGVAGESGGALLALATAQQTDAVAAVAVYEPFVSDVIGEKDLERFFGAVGRTADLAQQGLLPEALKAFVEGLATEEEVAAVSATTYFEDNARYVPAVLQMLEAQAEREGPEPTDPAALEQITAPVLLLHGADTALRDLFTDGVHHVAQHVGDAEVREIPDAGHLYPLLQGRAFAEELAGFFTRVLAPA